MRILLLALAAAAAVPATAQTRLKPGLWEMTSRTSGNTQTDQAMAEMRKQLEAMPADQRRQMEAMMASRGLQMAPGAGGGMAVRICLTREMVDRDDVPAAQGECRTTRQQRSGNTMTMAFTCSNPPSTGQSQVTFDGPEAFRSKTSVTGNGQAMTVEGSGRWIGADCGSVKPVTGR